MLSTFLALKHKIRHHAHFATSSVSAKLALVPFDFAEITHGLFLAFESGQLTVFTVATAKKSLARDAANGSIMVLISSSCRCIDVANLACFIDIHRQKLVTQRLEVERDTEMWRAGSAVRQRPESSVEKRERPRQSLLYSVFCIVLTLLRIILRQ